MAENEFIYKKTSNTVLTKSSFTSKAPSNIALVKYWGKEENQIPKNTSISFTLSACFTLTTLHIKKSDNPTLEVYFEGEKKDDFKPKILTFLDRIKEYCPYLSEYNLKIETRNSFPHSSGIASSASGMAALASCFMQMEKELNPLMEEGFFKQKASFLARLGSGSASRSLDGELVIWGEHKHFKDSSNLYGIKYPHKIHTNFKNFHDTILLVDKGEKQVSSTVGHNLMHHHPFAENRFKQANENIVEIDKFLQSGNLDKFIKIIESEALSLHAMMMTSLPYFMLMKPNTVEIIHRIWAFRQKTNLPVCFTLDAGANVHVLYPEKDKKDIYAFITKELVPLCQNNHYICDRVNSINNEYY